MTEIEETPASIWSESFKVRSYQVDTRGKCRLTCLLDFLQEAAGNHANNLGVGYKTLLDQELAWVLSRLFIHVEEYPEWGETITIETWPSAYDRIFAYRDFLFKNANGETIAKGKTAWIVMNIHSRRMTPVSLLVEKITHFPERLGIEEQPSKIVDKFSDGHPCNCDYVVLHSDLDTNYHVNNTRYVQWLLNDYGLEFHKDNQVSYLAINYLAEALPDQKLCHKFLKIQNQENQFLHQLRLESDDKLLCQSKIHWKAH